MESGKKKAAVLVGCNYPNTAHELYGCINDVLGVREALVERLGFERSQIELLTDAPAAGSLVMPTGVNISGHGTIIPSSKPGHLFRQDEAIVPCDFNLITG